MSHVLSRARAYAVVASVIAMTLMVPMFSMPAHAAHSSTAEPNDPLFQVPQWGPKQVRAEQAWHVTQGEGAVIGIVDSGVDLSHEDLVSQVLPGKTFVLCGDDGCGNGDWQTGQDEPSSHGTHVAGTAAAATDNGIGVAGVAPAAKILPVKVSTSGFLPCFAEAFRDIARGIRWAADNGAHVINLSLGHPVPLVAQGCEELFTDIHDAVAYANSKEVVTVAAAGNESFLLCSGPPGSAPGAICVTATDRREGRAAYSNEPLKEDLIAVAAPGGSLLPICREDVLSTVPAGTAHAGNAQTCGYPSNRAYEEFAGTSMASPHVAGVAGLVRARGCDRETTIDIITETARQPLTNPPVRGVFTPAYGYGIVDAEAAVAAAAQRCVVPPPNIAPVAGADSASTDEDSPVTIGVIGNDTDADGDPLNVAAVADGDRGTVVNNGDGTVTYTPEADLSGADTFTYLVSDGRAKSTGVVSVSIAPQPDAPVAHPDIAFFQANTPAIVPILTNDSDADGDELRIESVSQPKNGNVTITGSNVTFTPSLGFTEADGFTYRVGDGTGRSALGKVVLYGPSCTTKTLLENVEGVPDVDEDNPFARGWVVDTAASGDFGSTIWFPHKDAQARSATQSWFTDAAAPGVKDDRLVSPPVSVTKASVLSFWHRFVTEANFDGGVLEVSTDGGEAWSDITAAGGTFTQNGYNSTISPSDGSPIAGRSAWTGNVATMREVRVDLGALAGNTIRLRWRYAQDAVVPGVGWWVDDIAVSGLVNDACLVAVSNFAPELVDDVAFTNQGVATTIEVLLNDEDPDGDELFVLGLTQPSNGMAVNNEDGTLGYTPQPSFRGLDHFTYTVSDGRGGVATANVTVDVNGSPVATNDDVMTKEGEAVTAQVLANDSDPDGDRLIIASFTQPANGTVECSVDGDCTYTSKAGFSGDDLVTYEACDARAACDTAKLAIRVTPAGGEVSCSPQGRGFWRNQYDAAQRKFSAAQVETLTEHASYLSRGYFAAPAAVKAAVLNAYDTQQARAESQYAVLLLNLAGGDWSGIYTTKIGVTGREGLSSDTYDRATVGARVDDAATWIRSALRERSDLAKVIDTADNINNKVGLIC